MIRTHHRRISRLAAAILTVLVTGVTALGQLADTPWPTMNRDLQRTGRSPYVGPDEPIEKWRFQMEDGSHSGIAIGADGTIYVGDHTGLFYAVNPDGTEKWRFQTTGFTIHSAGPTIAADGTIYIGSQGIGGVGKGLHALNPDGTERWFFPTVSHVYGSVALDEDGTIYMGTRASIIYALDPDGREVWQFGGVSETTYFGASPAIGHDGRLYTPTQVQATDLYCLDRDGREEWLAPGHNSYGGACIGASGVIYTANDDGSLVATNPDGTLRWSVDIGDSYRLPCIGADGTIYAPGADELHAVSPDGIVQWVQPVSLFGRPVVDGQGTVYVGNIANSVYAYRPDGELRWIFNADGSVFRTQFAIDLDGTIYFAAFDGFLYALGPGPNLPCPGDLDDDGTIGVSDLLALLAAWGPCANQKGCPEDLDDNSVVGLSDLLTLLANWGPCP